MSSIEDQIYELQARILRQQAEIQALNAEIAELNRDLAPFRARYERIVQPIADQLEAVKAAIQHLKDLQFRQEMGWQEAAEAFETPWRSDTDSDTSAEDLPPVDQLPTTNTRKSDRIKSLYRQLARQYHPDLARSPQDRAFRTQLMSLINRAYVENDLATLERLEDPDAASESAASEVSSEERKLQRLQEKTAELNMQIRDLKAERSELRYGTLMELKINESLARSQGRNLLKEIAGEMEAEYWSLVGQLNELQSQLRSGNHGSKL